MRLGVIDIGSNAARLVIYRVWKMEDSIKSHQVEMVRYPIQLGHDVFNEGKISIHKAAKLSLLLKTFQGLMEVFEVEEHLAYATSALRDAANQQEILSDIAQSSSIRIQVISGKEEAELIQLAHQDIIADFQPCLLIDVGGGSTEISVYEGSSTLPKASNSFNLGSLRDHSDLEASEVFQATQSWLRDVTQGRIFQIICTGGNISKAQGIINSKKDKTVYTSKLIVFKQKINDMTLAERVNNLGLSPERADVMPKALSIYTALLTVLQAEFCYASGLSLRDGMLRKLIASRMDSL
jgi:exopolyphosphatase / guanosine-5'-triphosphate,3'-diphosphate pyrophosphatase